MKKFFSLLMVMSMVLSLCLSAFAAPGTDGSITINNADINETYNVYKIFEATYDGTAITYTINPGDEFFDDLFGDGTGTNDYFEYHAATHVVTRKAGKTDAELFTYLGNLIKSASATKSAVATATTLTIDGLTHGYYVIGRSNGVANGVTITNVTPNPTVNDKNDLPGQLEKKADKESVNVGDVLNYTVSFVATHYDDGEKVFVYTIEDTLTPAGWAAIDLNSIQIKVGGTTITKDTDWTLVSGTANGFEVDIPWVNNDTDKTFKYDPTVAVEITYSVTVLDTAVDPSGSSKGNTVELTWNNQSEPEIPSVKDETEVFNMGFTKVDGTDNTKTLPGAEFELYWDVAGVKEPVHVKVVDAAKGIYMYDGAADATNYKVTTPESGQIVIMGLAAGTYYLKETKAPAGYNKLDGFIEVVVGEEVTPSTDPKTYVETTMTIDGVDYKVHNAEKIIENNTGVVLPETGGEGTFALITIGTLLAIGFGVFLITHKKMSVYTD